MPRVLLLGRAVAHRLSRLLDAASAVGAELVWIEESSRDSSVLSGDPELARALERGLAPALSMPMDDPVLVAETVAARLGESSLDAVLPLDSEASVAAAAIAERLGLPGSPIAAVATSRDRDASRRRWFSVGVPHPEYRVVHLDDDVAHLARLVGLPCALMPVVSQGRRLVLPASTDSEAVRCHERLVSLIEHAPVGDLPLLVERRVGGRALTLWGWVSEGGFLPLASFESEALDDDPFGDRMWLTPPPVSPLERRELERVAADGVAALGLTFGPVLAELDLRSGFVRLRECTVALPPPAAVESVDLLCGHPVEELALRAAIGLTPEASAPAAVAAGALEIVAPVPGVLAAVEGVSEATAIDGVVEVSLDGIGRSVSPLPEVEQPLGWITSLGDSAGAVRESLRRARDTIRIEIRGARRGGSGSG